MKNLKEIKKNFQLDLIAIHYPKNNEMRLERDEQLALKAYRELKDAGKFKRIFANSIFNDFTNNLRDARQKLKNIPSKTIEAEYCLTCRKTRLSVDFHVEYNSNHFIDKSMLVAKLKRKARAAIKELRAEIKARPEKLTARQNLEKFKNRLKPISTKKIYTGLEVECYGPCLDSTPLMNSKTWFLKENDSSIEVDDDHSTYCEECDDYGCGCVEGYQDLELVVLTNESKLKKDCKAIGAALAYHEVNHTCGLHVHLDVRNSTGRKKELVFYNLVSSFQNLLHLMVPSSRYENNQYSQWNETKCFDHQKNIDDRYYAINAESFEKHNTIEVRLHSGTTNAEKIYNWALLLNKIADCKNLLTRDDFKTFESIQKAIGLDDSLCEYIASRISNFNRHNKLSTFNQLELVA